MGKDVGQTRMLGFLKRFFRKREFREWLVDESVRGYRIGDVVVRRLDVAVIVAFKRDLMTIDQVCLGIGYGEPDAGGGLAAEYIEEDNPSYWAVLNDLKLHFSLKDGWLEQVTRPAFATNWTTIWSKRGEAGRLAGQQGAAADDRPQAGDRG